MSSLLHGRMHAQVATYKVCHLGAGSRLPTCLPPEEPEHWPAAGGEDEGEGEDERMPPPGAPAAPAVGAWAGERSAASATLVLMEVGEEIACIFLFSSFPFKCFLRALLHAARLLSCLDKALNGSALPCPRLDGRWLAWRAGDGSICSRSSRHTHVYRKKANA